MKRTELRRSGSLRRVSPGRARQNRAYTVLRAEFLEAHPACEFPLGCGVPATDVHHMAGRGGHRLNDWSRWLPLCRLHHVRVTEYPAEAFDLGASIRRHGAA